MHIWDNANPVVEMSPEEAIALATELLMRAQRVQSMRQKLPGAYEFYTMSGADPEKQVATRVKIRIGEY